MEASETQDKDRGDDPGAARFGNFINYYSFNPPENRMKNIPGDLLNRLELTESPVTILDIGCNAGVSCCQALCEALGQIKFSIGSKSHKKGLRQVNVIMVI